MLFRSNAMRISGRSIVSLDQPISSDPGSDTIEDKIEADSSIDPLEVFSSKQLLLLARKVIDELSPKEAAILRLRFGLVEDVIEDESYKISQDQLERISQGEGMT